MIGIGVSNTSLPGKYGVVMIGIGVSNTSLPGKHGVVMIGIGVFDFDPPREVVLRVVREGVVMT